LQSTIGAPVWARKSFKMLIEKDEEEDDDDDDAEDAVDRHA
jgi:hypothetical protein